MSDEYENKTGYQAQSSETISSGSGGGSRTASDIDYVRPAEVTDQDLYHGHSFITKWVFCCFAINSLKVSCSESHFL